MNVKLQCKNVKDAILRAETPSAIVRNGLICCTKLLLHSSSEDKI